jgi:hypothetical protein
MPGVNIDSLGRKVAKGSVLIDPKLFGLAIFNPPEAHRPDGGEHAG